MIKLLPGCRGWLLFLTIAAAATVALAPGEEQHPGPLATPRPSVVSVRRPGPRWSPCGSFGRRDTGSYVLSATVKNQLGELAGGAALAVRHSGGVILAIDDISNDLDPTPGKIRVPGLKSGFYWVRQVRPPWHHLSGPAPSSGVVCRFDKPATPEDESHPSVTFINTLPPFVDVAVDAGLSISPRIPSGCEVDAMGLSAGGAWGDVDNDGDLDLFVTNLGGPNALYRNEGDGTFTEITPPLLADSLGHHIAAVFVDYDNDRDEDLFVTRDGGVNVYRNDMGEFVEVTDDTGYSQLGVQRFTGISFGDYDNDSFLDAFLTAHVHCSGERNQGDHLFHNDGDGTFSEVTHYLNANPLTPSNLIHSAFTSAWADFDLDGDLDIYVANDAFLSQQPQVLWRNEGSDEMGGWLFSDGTRQAGMNRLFYAMGAGIGDYNRDGCPDLIVSNIGPAILWKNQCNGFFLDAAEQAGVDRWHLLGSDTNVVTWGSGFVDFDNDGDQDIFLVAGYILDRSDQRNLFFRNEGDGLFTEISPAAGVAGGGRGRALALADYDNDGFVDMFVGNVGQPPRLYRNQQKRLSPNLYHWLEVKVVGRGQGPGTTNRDGIGSHIIVSTPDGLTQHWWVNSGAEHGGGSSKIAHFGLGSETSANVEVRFPGGAVYETMGVAADQILVVTEP